MSNKCTPIDSSILKKFEDLIVEYSPSVKHSTDQPINTETNELIRFLCLVGRLKTLPRRGWILLDRNIKNPESIAGHMYRMAVLGLLLLDQDDDDEVTESTKTSDQQKACCCQCSCSKNEKSKKFDFNKVVSMSLIHDLAECVVGDITPFDGITEEKKHQCELDSIQKLAKLLPLKASKRLLSLYEEYENRQSVESCLVKELDRFDVTLEAFQNEQRTFYHDGQRLVRFDEFFVIAQKNIRHPVLSKMVQCLIDERENFWSNQKQ